MSMNNENEAIDPEVANLLAVPPMTVDTARALERVRTRAARPSLQRIPQRWVQGLAAAATIAIVASALSLTGVAGSLLTIFEPQKFVAIPVNPTDFKFAPGLQNYGTLTTNGEPKPLEVADAAAARTAAGFTPLVPASLPSGISAAKWGVLKETSATFTFSAAQARDAASRAGRTPPPMPANMDGSKLVFTLGTTVVQMWAGQSLSGLTGGSPGAGGIPGLVVVQMRAPTVASDGVSVKELQTYLLAQPGIPAELAAQIGAIADPAHTLPVPVPTGMSTKNVKVQGSDGLFVGDSTGLGSGVVWRKGEFIFGVAGPLTESQLLVVANSLR